MTREDFKSCLGETLHTGWRKGVDHPESHKMWELINNLPPEKWDDYLEWCLYCFEVLKIIPWSDK